MKHSKLAFVLAMAALGPASSALAQGWTGVGVDPSAPPINPAPPPAAPTTAAQPTVIVVGPDGKPSAPASKGPMDSGVWHMTGRVYDDVGPTPELHVVKRGDTLWDICSIYFNDPWQWPKIWSFNPQITNPHWIYPGDLVRLLPRGVFVSNTPGQSNVKVAIPEDSRPGPARSFTVELKQTAFVDQEDIDRSLRVDGSVDEKALLSAGDAIFLTYDVRNPPKVGERFSIYRPGEKVKSKNKEVGSYVNLLGTIEITDVRKDKRARGVILETHEEIERGARVGKLIRKFATMESVPAKVNASGNIVALLSSSELIGQGEVVFIDQGKSSGLVPGNRMYVVRRGDALIEHMVPGDGVGQNDKRFPARALGEVVIVEVGKNISVGLITLAVQEMGVGDQVMMQAAKQ